MAVRWRWIPENPMAGLRGGSEANSERTRYITLEDTQRVLDACPDARWRAIFGLCRYAGLRCPSELAGLTWGNVDLVERRLRVASPKTKRHEGGDARQVPIVPMLAPLLEDLYDLAEPGEPRLFPRLGTSDNLRTTGLKILARAGLTPWPRLFHNLRASCETDWCEAHPMHVVSAWLGHSPKVAMKHYLRVRDDDFAKAAGLESGAKSGALVAQKAAQHVPASDGKNRKQGSQPVDASVFMRELAECNIGLHECKVAPPGFEPGTKRL
ncbi:MAG: site-specific integrase [Phycisphaeraceae bacterium]|nr:site-specific integrase [Phycisphaeraceae bacterium]